MRVLSSKIQFEVKNMTERPPFFCTLPADFISKEIEKHDGMPANVTECPPIFLLCLHISFRQSLKNMTECAPIF
jgi:hypothetical protein